MKKVHSNSHTRADPGDAITADSLAQLWKQWYGNARFWTDRLMHFIDRRQSAGRLRAIAILTYAKQTVRQTKLPTASAQHSFAGEHESVAPGIESRAPSIIKELGV